MRERKTSSAIFALAVLGAVFAGSGRGYAQTIDDPGPDARGPAASEASGDRGQAPEPGDSAVNEPGYGFDNPQPTRYLFAPSALGLEAGTGYYQNAYLVFNNVNYGVSDNVSIGAGTVPLFLFGVPATTGWILPKVSVSASERVHFAAGAMLGGMLVPGERVGAGLVYGLMTLGDREHNVTFGTGYGYAGGSVGRSPTFNVSGMLRASERIYLVTENYYFPWASAGLYSGAIRVVSESSAIDLGLVSMGGPAAPWVGVSLPFGG